MYGDVVEQIKDENGEDPFEECLGNFKKEKGAKTDLDLTADDLAELIKRYKAIYVKYGHEFPQDPKKQVMASAEAVFRSWNNERAIFTRKLEGIPDSFASFGTNDLTQTTLAISRDDADRFLPLYVNKEFFERHPFISIHPAVEKMVRTFVKDARAIDPKFEIFICGEHGGDVYTIGRLHEIGLTGVSMSPGKVYRSIIKAAQCQVQNPRKSVK